ncbi:unnamed protein product [Cylicostephanus goldi]|uniref:Phosphofurin acidic cluster sorting protein 1/2 N-terminal C2 domain-containing protein n=1 Tax=Cylicostephanus goldi TaxID=71465 RepID=A0A3P7N461_CYLGO|nr:unnamed protein product [Cylicostephanus goldi]
MMEKGQVVSMRLFANWEMDRASSSVVQRVCTLSLNRIVIHSLSSQIQSIVITAKLEGNKRSLRSNEIRVAPVHGRVDLDLDISFTIQVCCRGLMSRRRAYSQIFERNVSHDCIPIYPISSQFFD